MSKDYKGYKDLSDHLELIRKQLQKGISLIARNHHQLELKLRLLVQKTFATSQSVAMKLLCLKKNL